MASTVQKTDPSTPPPLKKSSPKSTFSECSESSDPGCGFGGSVSSGGSGGSGSSGSVVGAEHEQLPYNGDLQEAMRKQDRSAIRLLMQHQQKQRKQVEGEGEGEGVAAKDPTQEQAQTLRQMSICPCALNCGDNRKEDLTKLPSCDHEMHSECLEGLLNTRNSTCPLCRSSIESLRRNEHFTEIDKEIEEAWQADLARAMAMSTAASAVSSSD
jgi:hypothetical protein